MFVKAVDLLLQAKFNLLSKKKKKTQQKLALYTVTLGNTTAHFIMKNENVYLFTSIQIRHTDNMEKGL